MTGIVGLPIDVFFGNPERRSPDWRDEPIEDDRDPDDEELEETPADVIAILGFDPKDL